MKRSFIQTWFIIALIGSITISSCSSSRYKPSEYISTTSIASPGVETKIELEDGAAIVIPASSIENEVSVKVERNPEKANNLPPLDEGVVGVGDFYNFEIDGTLNGPVDLVLPFDPDSVPENKEGVLVVAIPTENGWKYIPVVPDGNKVTIYTDEVGDPIIGWHFSNCERCELEEVQFDPKFCNPTIALNVTPESGESNQSFTVTGRVIPLEGAFTTTMGDKLASLILGQETSSFRDLPIEIVINNDPKKTISTRTNQDGSFEVTINPEQDSSLGYKEQVNWLKASTQCSSIFDPNSSSEAVGYSYFYISPKEQTQTSDPQPTESPAPVETQIPAGTVLLPDFVGQDIDNAIDWLESNGFKYTWIDGSSTYDLGMVFKQAPAGGQYKVPHRTVVVLYRTNEQIEDTYGCDATVLTSEEMANCGTHEYNSYGVITFTKGGCWWGDTTEKTWIDTFMIVFAKDGKSFKFEESDIAVWGESDFIKVGENLYSFDFTVEDYHFFGTITFNRNGFVYDETKINPIINCNTHVEYTILK